MLTIRIEQFDAFREVAAGLLAEELAIDFATRYADRLSGLSFGEIADLVRRDLCRAVRYGFDRRIDLASFAELSLAIGPHFDEYPPIHEILADLEIPPEDRIDIALDEIPEEEWEQARWVGVPPERGESGP